MGDLETLLLHGLEHGGRGRQAPRWMQRAGLEWLYRVLRQPSRLPRALTVPRLIWMTLREVLKRRQ